MGALRFPSFARTDSLVSDIAVRKGCYRCPRCCLFFPCDCSFRVLWPEAPLLPSVLHKLRLHYITHLTRAAPALSSLPSVDLPLSFRSSHFSVGAHPSGVVVPNASPVVQLGLPGLCHLSAAASGRAPPFRLSSFPYPRVPVLYDSIAAGPRQAAVATPVAGGCRFVPVGALVLGPSALPLR